MVVDDDPQVLAVMRSLLEPWGLKLTTLDEPRHFWTILEEFAPDLLVLDVEMPHFNGIELCQVVRNAPRWSGLPVLFLTVHTDASTVHQVFSAGADDIVSKPIVGPELVTRVLNRLERVQLLRKTNDTNSELTTPCFEITAPGAEVAAQRVRGDEI
jgi:DNA-binding response OmpR family regulator